MPRTAEPGQTGQVPEAAEGAGADRPGREARLQLEGKGPADLAVKDRGNYFIRRPETATPFL